MTTPTVPKQPNPPLPPVDKDDDNEVRKELSKGDVRPDGPGDETAPVKPEPEKH
ncbi:MAG: hypothetical protein H0T89_03445 [Deltaproteobacteria bacterium]|nr:hypothetical protein [Deltaproteobacteria bacterium]MDQ3299569.1 hypothetical protein [Myxococcota bacterium]